MRDRDTRRGVGIGELLIAAGVIAIGVVVGWQAAAIPVSPLYAKVGPKVIPTLAAVALVGLGLSLLVGALRGGWQTEEEASTPSDLTALALVGAGLIANVALIVPAGFTVASVVMFVLVARAFGSRRSLRDAGIAAGFSLIAYFGFARALGINIGAGPLERAIDTALGVVVL